jgi:hypothetical protein
MPPRMEIISLERLGRLLGIWKTRTKVDTRKIAVEYQIVVPYEPTPHKSVDYRAFRLQITTEGIIEIFAQ